MAAALKVTSAFTKLQEVVGEAGATISSKVSSAVSGGSKEGGAAAATETGEAAPAPAPAPKPKPKSTDDDSEWEKRCSMSKKTRLYGFASCVGIGFLLSFLAFLTWASPTRFAVLYTFGTLTSLGASFFMFGPRRYFRAMFDPKRRWSAIALWASLALTLVAALALHSVILSIIMALVQAGCMGYYCLSYIPFGRQLARSAVMQCFKRGG